MNFIRTGLGVVLAGIVLGLGLILALYYLGEYRGRRELKRPIEWYSQINGAYVIDIEPKCRNGKSLGRIQVDLNLTNGKLRVVRNDPGKWPVCE